MVSTICVDFKVVIVSEMHTLTPLSMINAAVRGFDVEYFDAQKANPTYNDCLPPVDDPIEFIRRIHIPEDFGEERYHVGRYLRHSTPASDKERVVLLLDKRLLRKERWVRKPQSMTLESWD